VSVDYVLQESLRPCLNVNEGCLSAPGRNQGGLSSLPSNFTWICLDLFSSLRSEEHTSELQSRFDLVCRLLLEKKKKKIIYYNHYVLLHHPILDRHITLPTILAPYLAVGVIVLVLSH